MSVTLYVWRRNVPLRLMGHAALRIGTQYVSFWPSADSNLTHWVMKSSVESQLMQHLTEDALSEGKRRPEIVELSHLDTGKMLAELRHLSGHQYNVVHMNCATFAARLMHAGSSIEQSFTPIVDPSDYVGQGKLSSYITAANNGPIKSWTPEHLLTYAKELNQAVARTIPLPAPLMPINRRLTSPRAMSPTSMSQGPTNGTGPRHYGTVPPAARIQMQPMLPPPQIQPQYPMTQHRAVSQPHQMTPEAPLVRMPRPSTSSGTTPSLPQYQPKKTQGRGPH